ncbi:MAG: carbamoyltransferase N-terminal domain-containing protein, partial [Candidatus Binatia bacterium]
MCENIVARDESGSDGSFQPEGMVIVSRKPSRFLPSQPPALIVVVDTEEEFDWSAPFDRRATSVEAMSEIGRFQDVCERFAIRPTYVVDYPVATQSSGFGELRDLQRSGRAVIGAHLHPWVTPPFEEAVTAGNSYPGNLPRELESGKLRTMVEAIGATFGSKPTVYKAGRYGFGANTAELLRGLGFQIDLSFCPPFDFRADGGPDFSAVTNEPFWFDGDAHAVLEIPNTGAFVGALGSAAGHVYRPRRPPGACPHPLAGDPVAPAARRAADADARGLFSARARAPHARAFSPRRPDVRIQSPQPLDEARLHPVRALGRRPARPSRALPALLRLLLPKARRRDDDASRAQEPAPPRLRSPGRMKILGISPLDKDATASVVEDGAIVYGAGEERFSRVKQHAGFPGSSVRTGLSFAGWRPEDVDVVAYPFLTWKQEARLIRESLAADHEARNGFPSPDLRRLVRDARRRAPERSGVIHGLRHPDERMSKSVAKRLFYLLAGGTPWISRRVAGWTSRSWARQAIDDHRRFHAELERGLDELGLLRKLRRFEHHLSHTSNAYLASGYDRALIVTLDGYGTGLAGSVGLGEGGKIRRLAALRFPHSLGIF